MVAARGRLMQALPTGGAMIAIQATEDEVTKTLAGLASKISLAAINGPNSVVLSGDEDTAITFTTADFAAAYSDPGGDPLAKVVIRTLPAHGTLRLGGAAVVVGQEVAAAQLGSLTFTPDADWNGATAFEWQGHDGIDPSAGTARARKSSSARARATRRAGGSSGVRDAW